MILSMYTDNVLSQIKNNIDNNFDKYCSGTKFVDTFVDDYSKQLYSLGTEVEYPNLDLTISSPLSELNQWEIDFNNAVKLHREFVLKYKIGIEILSDERFIAYLTHDIYHNYMSKRWPVTEKSKNRIKEKYFLPSGSQGFTRNTFLRYFWYTYITYDETLEDPYEYTKVAFEFADPINQVMERKYSKNKKLVLAILQAVKETPNSNQLKSKRTLLGKSINNMLGLICLDAFPKDQIVSIIKSEISGIVDCDDDDVQLDLEEE